MPIDTVGRFAEKKQKDQATATHVDHKEAFEELARLQPDYPIWPLVVELQTLFASAANRDYHARFDLEASKSDTSIAVLWKSKLRGEGEMFLSVQASERPVPRALQVAPSEILDEFLEMIEDINANDSKNVTYFMAGIAVLAMKRFLVTCIDGDPETNSYTVQAYTQDRKYLVDVQLDYAVIQDDLDHLASV